MPTVDSLDYERFTFDEAPSKSLTLDEATKKAADLRKEDDRYFYRVRMVDENSGTFQVEKVAKASAYASFLERLSKTWIHYLTSKPIRK
jgi:hypothetical protein